jgi:hypothetical protein
MINPKMNRNEMILLNLSGEAELTGDFMSLSSSGKERSGKNSGLIGLQIDI